MKMTIKEKKTLFRTRPPIKLTPEERQELKAREILADYTDAQLEYMSYGQIARLVDRSAATIRQRVVRNNMSRREAAICIHIPKHYAINGGIHLRTGLVATANKYDVNVSTLASARTRYPKSSLEELAKGISERKKRREARKG